MSQLLIDVLESFLGENRKNNEDTGQITFDCPECDDGRCKGNLEINYNRNVFKCWSCADTNNMSGSVMKLLKKYGSKNNIRDYLLIKPDASTLNKKNTDEIIVELPEGYKRLSDCTNKDYKLKAALKYLDNRGITKDIIDEFDIGYTTIGSYYDRIIIPSYDSELKLTYFIARWFSNKYNKMKYLNPHAEKQEIIFNESHLNLDSTIYIVEGVFDSLAIPNSIPLLGKHISDNLLELLHDSSNGYVVVVLDSDAWEDAKHLYRKLEFGKLIGRIKICECPVNYDPSKIFEEYGYRGIVKLLKNSRKLSNKELSEF